ncbi:MAG: SpoIID/LytB domain-containing protein [Vicinamibacterales bacterium]
MSRRRRAVAALGWLFVLAVGTSAGAPAAPPAGTAWFVRSLADPTDRREAGSDVLDTPVLAGSVMKAVTLAAALESQVVTPDTRHVCRRVVTIDGQRFVCSHPDLKRPLTPAEALAHSCNDFFVSLAPRLPRGLLNQVRQAAGLPPIAANTPLAPALVGLAGPRVTPRALLDVIARLAGADRDRPVRLQATTRRILLDGLRGAATYGTASALSVAGVPALAKTGTAPMPGGGFMGLAVALTPPDAPTRGVVVVAPGAAGADAAALAAELLKTPPPPAPPAATARPVAVTPPPAAGAAPGVSALVRDVAADPGAAALKQASSGITIRLGVTQANGRVRVQRLPLEDYVARVIAGEGEPKAPDAAQQALAVVIRTFALANQHRHRKEGFDLCDTTHCQVARASTATTRRAALATAGRLLLDPEGQPAFVFYSAWCGGHTEIASRVWPGAEDYGQRASIEDRYCATEPGWSSEVRVRDVERALRAAGLRGDRLRDLRIAARDPSGRVLRVRAEGFSPSELGGHEFRMAVGRVAGWQALKSTAFDLQRTGAGYRFQGAGFGHGVGLCVIGAGNRAEAGLGVDDILHAYFPTLAVGPRGLRAVVAEVAQAPEPPPVAAAAAAPAASSAGIALALPAAEERDRAVVLDLLVRARGDISTLAGVTPPASVRVTVHPSVDSFGRETGQPWWVAGATVGNEIDLLPLDVLRRQGQLERTVRHEMAHVIVDGVLTGRPVWVREGAAFYFADPRGGGDLPTRVQCPSDEELLRPVSAGAQREAYGRAEACFRREIAAGKRWNDIK